MTRRHVVVLAAAALVGSGAALLAPHADAGPRPVCQSDVCTVTFASGSDTFVVPDKITRVDIVAVGARGSAGEPGAKVTSTIGVEAGQILDITVARETPLVASRAAAATTTASAATTTAATTTSTATSTGRVATSASGATTVSRGSDRLVVAAGGGGSSSVGDSVSTTADAPTVVVTYFDPSTIPDGPTCSGWSCLFDS